MLCFASSSIPILRNTISTGCFFHGERGNLIKFKAINCFFHSFSTSRFRICITRWIELNFYRHISSTPFHNTCRFNFSRYIPIYIYIKCQNDKYKGSTTPLNPDNSLSQRVEPRTLRVRLVAILAAPLHLTYLCKRTIAVLFTESFFLSQLPPSHRTTWSGRSCEIPAPHCSVWHATTSLQWRSWSWVNHYQTHPKCNRGLCNHLATNPFVLNWFVCKMKLGAAHGLRRHTRPAPPGKRDQPQQTSTRWQALPAPTGGHHHESSPASSCRRDVPLCRED